MSKRLDGINLYNDIYCGELPQLPLEGEDRFFDFMLESLFGELWSDQTITIRDKRLLLLGAIMAQGEELTFEIHVRSAMKRGELNVEQVEFAVLFLTQYIGYPKASRMRIALKKVIADS